MEKRTIITNHPCVCTTGNMLVEGEMYLYREGSHRDPVILEEILETGEWLKLRIYFPAFDKRGEVVHKNTNFVYSGMWRLFDFREEEPDEDWEDDEITDEDVMRVLLGNASFEEAEGYDINDARVERMMEEHEEGEKPGFDVKSGITLEKFLDNLSYEQMGGIVKHFKGIYDCKGLYEKEKKLAYLAWLIGKKHLLISDNFLIYDLMVLEFEYGDYRTLLEDDLSGDTGIERVREFYELDSLFDEVLKEISV